MLRSQTELAAMVSNAMFAEVGALAGDPARACMLMALMDGRALTASELARFAGIAPQTASGHLSRLTMAALLCVEQQGRHRYYRLASDAVARMLESILQVAAKGADGRARLTTGPRDAALRAARTCYDHLAGRLGVALADALVAHGHVELASDGGVLTESGVALLDRLGIDVTARSGKRVLCRPCLDWSERRAHLAGIVGAAICTHCFSAGWTRRVEGTRAVTVTPKGRRAFQESFGLHIG
jgi:DNA-binding transcriptional ArsR family regulator